jgi:acetyl esterase/lipase
MRSWLATMLVLAATAGAWAGPAAVTSDVPYGELPRQRLDLYMPAGDTRDAPVLVFFYGGGWERGAKEDLRDTATALTAAGMIVALPDYRLYPQAVFPQFVEDCALAVARVGQTIASMGGHHPLFVGGHSAGAYNAAMLAADERYLAAAGVPPDAVAGYVLLSGPYYMGGYLPRPLDAIFPAAVRGGASVAGFIDGSEPPLLLMTVDADEVVDPRNTYLLADTVRAKGGRVTVATYQGSSDHIATFHGLSDPGSAVRKDLAAFIASGAGW